MPTITAIKPQKNQKRVNIYLDGKFGFGLDLENYLKLGLKVEQELPDEKIAEIVKKAEFQKISDKLLRFATFRPRSEKEVRDWFKRKKIHESLHQDLFNRLKHLEFLDDKKFSKWWVEQRIAFKPRGKRVLSQELRQKGVDRETIEETLSEIKIDEEKAAGELLAKKAYRWEKLPRLEARRKMTQFLGRKGFGWETIEKIIEKR